MSDRVLSAEDLVRILTAVSNDPWALVDGDQRILYYGDAWSSLVGVEPMTAGNGQRPERLSSVSERAYKELSILFREATRGHTGRQTVVMEHVEDRVPVKLDITAKKCDLEGLDDVVLFIGRDQQGLQ